MFSPKISALAFAALLATAVHAHEYTVKNISVGHPYARTTVQAQTAGAAYLSLENKGGTADRLVAVSVPADVAAAAQIHTMSQQGNVMRMSEVDGIDLTPSARVDMRPGDGYHIMLIGLKKPLAAGEKVPLTLTFAKAGAVEVNLHVEAGKPLAAPKSQQEDSHLHH
ncbi:copper chaperone PCu(A)C [Noviherbaspirillum malthae]|jgi:copper(I)-binding protein|uniref:copper chaperone PCu(A)C n=1 Tax=Noviherbaspirillum malthae TaxID=1260987 RepID=UPI00188F7BB7|nr:copper chaperone PCu(A)C [Noviherbaspirillum malthae]